MCQGRARSGVKRPWPRAVLLVNPPRPPTFAFIITLIILLFVVMTNIIYIYI